MKNDSNLFEINRCKSDSKNKFYLDTSNYGFKSKLEDEYNGPKYENNYIKKSTVAEF
jgi:hypothetical protein